MKQCYTMFTTVWEQMSKNHMSQWPVGLKKKPYEPAGLKRNHCALEYMPRMY